MSLAHPPPPPHLCDGVLPAAGRFPSVPGCLGSRGILRCSSGGRVAGAYCLFSGGGNRKKQEAGKRGQPTGPAGAGGWAEDGLEERVVQIFLIANFNAMIAAVVNSLLGVLRQLRRLLSFIVQCALQSASITRSGPKSSNLDSSNLTGVPVKGWS
ncbi:hypothetical protein PR202_ga16708 [Eleusine coracana subsp. coracana]|uniref:Uncharacterized protein n=1 Tax=Eleusine coracana subsp. coracana TaxID=191504 RepID=A0AAV5CNZ4_ELECO|nr:hypothetical protein PR202_ga16708 [Eleusine coracana subsp. coracana]